MKKNILNLSFSVLALSAFAGVAFAATSSGDTMMKNDSMKGDAMMTDHMTPSSMMMMHPPAPTILSVESNGMGRIRGVVSAVSTTSISVATWGGIWTITADAHTQIVPAGYSLSNIKVGDYVGAMGSVSEDGPVLMAKVLRNWTAKHDAMMSGDHMNKSDTMMKGDSVKSDHMTGTSSDVMTH